MDSFLTAAQISLLKKSFRQLDTAKVATEFYARLFDKYPEVKPLFHQNDLSDLAIKLMSVFELVVFSFEEKRHDQFDLQEPLIVPLRHLGKIHEDKGVKADHYVIANRLLLETMRDLGGGPFNDDVSNAWEKALAILSTAMQNKDVQIKKGARSKSGGSLREAFVKFLKI